MMRRFDHAEISRIARVMQALLPESCKVQCTPVAGGFEVAVTVCGADGCRTAEFPASLNDRQLLVLAECWKSGRFVDVTGDVMRAAHAAQSIDTPAALTAWVRSARRGSKAIYFRGEMARFRHEAQQRVIRLQTLSDRAKKSTPRPASEGLELVQLQERLALLSAVQHLHEAHVVELVQSRIPDGSGATFYAVKR